MELIDRAALGVGRCSKDVLPAAYCAGWNGLLNIINDAPTISAVNVVRCRECVHNHPEFVGNEAQWCELYRTTINPDDFCSYGQRKEADHD